MQKIVDRRTDGTGYIGPADWHDGSKKVPCLNFALKPLDQLRAFYIGKWIHTAKISGPI